MKNGLGESNKCLVVIKKKEKVVESRPKAAIKPLKSSVTQRERVDIELFIKLFLFLDATIPSPHPPQRYGVVTNKSELQSIFPT